MVQILFPNKQPLDSAFTSDMRLSKSLQRLAKRSYGAADYGFFNAHDFTNFSNSSAHYENNDLFTMPIVSIRNGRRNLWTEKTALVYTPLTAEQQVTIAWFPWTAMAEKIRLLTDGRCGSACGMAEYFYTTKHNVESYAIGGTFGEGLSIFSFAGASVLRLSEIQDFYSSADLTSPMSDLPYQSIVTFSWLELYGKGRTIPFEYDSQFFIGQSID